MDQKQALTTLIANLETLKKEDPAVYLAVLKDAKDIVSDLNQEIKTALAEAKS